MRSVDFSVCLYSIYGKTAEPIRPTFCITSQESQSLEGLWLVEIEKNLLRKRSFFFKSVNLNRQNFGNI